MLKDKISKMNFFIGKNSGSIPRNIERVAIISTRIYTIALISSIFTLAIFARLQEITIVETIESPSLMVVEKLKEMYPTTLSCPCEQIAIPYKKFLTVQVKYHQVRYYSLRGL